MWRLVRQCGGVRSIQSGGTSKTRGSAIFGCRCQRERISIDLTGSHLPAKDSERRTSSRLSTHFTKWAEACPLPNKEVTTTTCALVEQVFTCHGMPVQILSDQEMRCTPPSCMRPAGCTEVIRPICGQRPISRPSTVRCNTFTALSTPCSGRS